MSGTTLKFKPNLETTSLVSSTSNHLRNDRSDKVDYKTKVERIVQIQSTDNPIEDVQQQIRQTCQYFILQTEKLSDELYLVKEAIYNRVLTPKQAAKVLSISESSVIRKIKDKKLGGHKEETRWKTTVAHLVSYMQKNPNEYSEEMTIDQLVKFI